MHRHLKENWRIVASATRLVTFFSFFQPVKWLPFGYQIEESEETPAALAFSPLLHDYMDVQVQCQEIAGNFN